MRCSILAIAVGFLLGVQPVLAADLCGERPAVSDPAVLDGVLKAAAVFKISAAAANTFADLAQTFYRSLARDRPSEEALPIAAALLVASCEELTRGEDPAKLPWHVKDKLAGLATLVPDFPQGRALLERIKATEAAR
jgi:hypothetical protein